MPIKAENAYLYHGRITKYVLLPGSLLPTLTIIPLMKNNVYLLLVLGLFVFSCEPKETSFTYGKDGVLYPGEENDPAPAFQNMEGKGNFSSYPTGLAIDSETGRITVGKSNPGYKYLVRFVAADGKSMTHTYVTIAGFRYPSRFFNLSDSRDTIARPVVVGGESAGASFEITASPVTVNNTNPTGATLRRQPARPLGGVVRAAFTNSDGSINLRQLADGLFGLTSGITGSVDLTVAYKATIGGKNVTSQTRYVIRRENIVNDTVRVLLRNFANFDKVMEAKQRELLMEEEPGTGKSLGPIKVSESWELGYRLSPATSNDIFRFTGALQNHPPPNPAEGVI